MGYVSEWESQIDEKNYSFTHEKTKGKHVLTVNGDPTVLKASAKSVLLGFDEPFMLDGKEARLVFRGRIPDIVIDGKYLQSGKTYMRAPVWAYIFSFSV